MITGEVKELWLVDSVFYGPIMKFLFCVTPSFFKYIDEKKYVVTNSAYHSYTFEWGSVHLQNLLLHVCKQVRTGWHE